MFLLVPAHPGRPDRHYH